MVIDALLRTATGVRLFIVLLVHQRAEAGARDAWVMEIIFLEHFQKFISRFPAGFTASSRQRARLLSSCTNIRSDRSVHNRIPRSQRQPLPDVAHPDETSSTKVPNDLLGIGLPRCKSLCQNLNQGTSFSKEIRALSASNWIHSDIHLKFLCPLFSGGRKVSSSIKAS